MKMAMGDRKARDIRMEFESLQPVRGGEQMTRKASDSSVITSSEHGSLTTLSYYDNRVVQYWIALRMFTHYGNRVSQCRKASKMLGFYKNTFHSTEKP